MKILFQIINNKESYYNYGKGNNIKDCINNSLFNFKRRLLKQFGTYNITALKGKINGIWSNFNF